MSERERDYYGVLGIPPTASQSQIKAAYRRQALRHHPDKNPDSSDASDRFKLCSEAYNTLSDVDARERYDVERLREASVGELFSIVKDMIGNRQRAGRDLRYAAKLTLEEAAHGIRRRITFAVERPCDGCSGTGGAEGGTVRCVGCNGRGFRSSGLLSVPRICALCGGQGSTIERSCELCSGVGNVEAEQSYLVNLLPGVRDGDVKVIERQGAPGSFGGRPGDLHVEISILEHSLFRLEGDDVWITLPICFSEAALGASVDVPTLDSFVRMRIPPGTQSGRRFRLGGKGFPSFRAASRGDQIVEVVVETPTDLEPEQQRLLVEIDEAGNNPRCRAYAEAVEKLRDARESS